MGRDRPHCRGCPRTAGRCSKFPYWGQGLRMAALEAGRRSSTFRFQKGDCRQPRSPRPAHSSPVNIKETFCNRSDLMIGASRAPFPRTCWKGSMSLKREGKPTGRGRPRSPASRTVRCGPTLRLSRRPGRGQQRTDAQGQRGGHRARRGRAARGRPSFSPQHTRV